MKKKFTPTIVVIGSSNTDMIVQLTEIPAPGETLLGGKFVMAAGGKGANQAVAAARAGGHVAFVACLGDDVFGDRALADFEKEGIEVSKVTRIGRSPSGVALIFVSEKGENSIAVASGANSSLRPVHIIAARELIHPNSWVVFQLETPLNTVAFGARLAKRRGARVILNPAPAAALTAGLLRNVDILTPNEHEASQICGFSVTDVSSARNACKKLRGLGVGGVIITLGSQGAYVSVNETEMLVPGFKVRAVDTTAAGDVFNGSLAVALSEGRGILDAVRFAHAAASISVTRLGAQPSIPNRREINKRLRIGAL